MLNNLKRRLGLAAMSEEEYQQAKQEILRDAPVPMFWLFGKTGSGKTSLVKYLTGAEEAGIGTGYRPQTKHSRLYDFPSADQPVLRFLDTRGLAEGEYDPQEDIERFNQQAHLVYVIVRAMDHALESVVEPLKKIRQAAPHRPVLLVLTCLHEAYPGQQHPQPDPFRAEDETASIPPELKRSMRRQTERFAGLFDYLVPVDLTKPEEGFDAPNFGGERLKATTLAALPDAYRQTFLNLETAMRPLKDLNEQRATPYVISYSTLAATAAAVPTPWVDIPVVLALQSHLVYRLQSIYEQKTDAGMVRRLAAISGGRLLTSLAIRGTLKFIPFVGMAANAALAYGYTYALGKTCCWYFGEVQAGNAPSEEQVRQVWQKQLQIARNLWRDSRYGENEAPDAADQTGTGQQRAEQGSSAGERPSGDGDDTHPLAEEDRS